MRVLRTHDTFSKNTIQHGLLLSPLLNTGNHKVESNRVKECPSRRYCTD
jgi:hypothetical protein